MDKFVKNLNHTWKFIHVHHNNHGNNASYELGHLDEWKAAVEQQGCKFLGIVNVREPLEHALAIMRWKDNGLSLKDFIASELGYFLYNNKWRDARASKQEKVLRALEILEKYYSVVTVGSNFTYTVEQITRWTGWDMTEFPHENSGMNLNFSKSDIELIQQTLYQNGDMDFYDAVRHKYTNSLDYYLEGA